MDVRVSVAIHRFVSTGTDKEASFVIPPTHADFLMNCLVHMHDPEGSMRCSGVNGGHSDEQVCFKGCAARGRGGADTLRPR